MTEPYWWYVLFVRVNTEHKVVKDFNDFIKSNTTSYDFEAFVPESERYYRSKANKRLGKHYLKRPLFPGYVFIETNMPAVEFMEFTATYIYNSADIIRLLKQGNSKEIAISLEERQRFEYLLKGKRCLEHSVGYIEGDKIVITGGPLIGMEGSVKHINRHNRSAQIELDMFNQKQVLNVALEILSKISG